MPARNLACHACHTETKDLVKHKTYGYLCQGCSSIADDMEDLVTKWDAGASNNLGHVIVQLRRLARQLQRRMDNDRPGDQKAIPKSRV